MLKRGLRVLNPSKYLLRNYVPITQILPLTLRKFKSSADEAGSEECAENLSAISLAKQSRVLGEGKEKWTKRELLKYFGPFFLTPTNKRLFIVSCVLLGISKGLIITSPFMLKLAVNSLSTANAMQTVSASILGFGLMRSISSILNEIRSLKVFKMNQNAMRDISNNMFRHIHEMDFLYHRAGTRGTMFAISKAIRNVESGLRFMLTMLAPIGVELTMVCGMLLFYCGPQYVLNILLTIGAYTLYTKQYSITRQNYIRRRKNVEKAQELFLNESITNYEAVKFFQQENNEQIKYNSLIEIYRKVAKNVAYSLSQINFWQNLIFTTGLCMNLLMSGIDCIHGILTPGDFVMLQALFMQVGGPLNNMGTMFREVDEAHMYLEEILKVMSVKPKVCDSPTAQDLCFRGGGIQFRDVSFAYGSSAQGGEDIFKGVNFEIKAGQQVALVGKSGFGKTTIFNMIFRLFDPDEGEILIDGQNIRDVKLGSLRKHITIVPQSGMLFNESIIFNLRFSNPSASMEEIIEVSKKCQIHEHIMELSKGYESTVGELGSKLSGGERQRIIIARGLLKKASIFLFDEATSSLDATNEKLIVQELRDILRGKTVIYCAHRLTSIINCDNIIVMDQQRVIEQGTHYQLLARLNSKYADFWRQFLGGGDDVSKEQVDTMIGEGII